MDALKDAILKLSTQMDEIRLYIGEIKETISKQRNEALLDRLTKLESGQRDVHVKLDALNAIDINPTIEAPRPAAVRVAGAKKKVDKDDDKKDDAPKEETKEEEVDDAPQQFSNITEYFKHVWVTDRARLFEKNVYSQKEYDELYEANKADFDKKAKKNELLLQKSIATKIWRSLNDERKEIVKAMKDQNAKDINKKASKDVEAEE
jgi:hypothetical protein